MDILEQLKNAPYTTSAIRRDAIEEIERLRTAEQELESLRAQLKAAMEQEPIARGYRNSITGTCSEIFWLIDPPEGETMLYATPIPQKSPAVVVPEVTPQMLRAAQIRSELGSYACSNLSGGYDLIRELFEVMISESSKSPRINEQDAREIAMSAWRYWMNGCGRTIETWVEEEWPNALNKLNGAKND